MRVASVHQVGGEKQGAQLLPAPLAQLVPEEEPQHSVGARWRLATDYNLHLENSAGFGGALWGAYWGSPSKLVSWRQYEAV